MGSDTKKLLLVAGIVIALIIFLFISSKTGKVPMPGRIETFKPSPVTTQVAKNANEIIIENYTYSPANLIIKQGDTITWVNKDTVAHTATADDGSFDTGLIGEGEEKSITFNTSGTFSYYCIPHPQMKGTIIVE